MIAALTSFGCSLRPRFEGSPKESGVARVRDWGASALQWWGAAAESLVARRGGFPFIRGCGIR